MLTVLDQSKKALLKFLPNPLIGYVSVDAQEIQEILV
jgi:hypothetical protein